MSERGPDNSWRGIPTNLIVFLAGGATAAIATFAIIPFKFSEMEKADAFNNKRIERIEVEIRRLDIVEERQRRVIERLDNLDKRVDAVNAHLSKDRSPP